jgi:hypothetical protein
MRMIALFRSFDRPVQLLLLNQLSINIGFYMLTQAQPQQYLWPPVIPEDCQPGEGVVFRLHKIFWENGARLETVRQ